VKTPRYDWVTTQKMKRERDAGVDIGRKPPKIRIYDNGGLTADRFTIVDTRPSVARGVRYYPYYGASEDPYHPQGVGMYGETEHRPYVKQAGETEPRWQNLPPNARKLALQMVKERQ
jgi:hypothetical protein